MVDLDHCPQSEIIRNHQKKMQSLDELERAKSNFNLSPSRDDFSNLAVDKSQCSSATTHATALTMSNIRRKTKPRVGINGRKQLIYDLKD